MSNDNKLAEGLEPGWYWIFDFSYQMWLPLYNDGIVSFFMEPYSHEVVWLKENDIIGPKIIENYKNNK